MNKQLYSCLKVSEGGPVSQKEAIKSIKAMGATVLPAYSCYVGHFGLEVEATEKQHKEIEEYLFG